MDFLAGAEARDALAVEREEKLVGLLKGAIARIDAKDALLVAYRVGKRPSEKSWQAIESSEAAEADARTALAEHHAAKGEDNVGKR
ncbi:MAG: hypothetical protein KF767_08765 [Bdellovibrionaceae bacterium]|nr:hypothetical protein [Pseudobdellovibrionaceae bacterium]